MPLDSVNALLAQTVDTEGLASDPGAAAAPSLIELEDHVYEPYGRWGRQRAAR